MAAPINLKANTPGGNSFKKSASAQKPYKSKPVPQKFKPALRVDKGTPVGAKGSAYASSKAITVPKITVDGKTVDYASQWMGSKGLKHPQNAGTKPRVPWANVPADGIGAASGSLNKTSRTASKPNPAKRTTSKSSSGPTTSRVKAKFTGKSFKVAARPKVLSARKG